MRKQIKKILSVVMTAALVTVSTVTMPAEKAVAATAGFTNVGGWNETIYAQISGVSDADVTSVSYSGPVTGSLTGEDFKYLVRDNNGGVRIDIPGMKEGTYSLTVVTANGTVTKDGIVVNAQDRSGYAHFNYTEGVGAYNDDGTLKDNAIVLYVTDDNKNTVTVKSKDGTTVTGIGNILNSAGKDVGTGVNSKGGKANTNQDIIRKLAQDGTPLDIRIIGDVKAPEGVTAFDSIDYGGTEGDNGYMVRMQSGKDITIEGIGHDASINGWGIHFIAQSSDPDFGKSFEVKNISFANVPEDCVGMEGVQEGSTLTASVERCWVHHCEFNVPHISNPAESDKGEGDGACDFKRGQYFTNSYCYYAGYHKTNLVGSSDSSLQYNITYHHNYWQNCESRGPLGRQANVHMYNNIFENQSSYAMNTRANCYIFSEYNLFYMVKSPHQVKAGAIKSYNDSFSSCIGDMGGTIVTDKSAQVKSGNKYENFDTNATLSYIPSGDYELQESITEARKVIYAQTGVMKERPVSADDVTMSMISVVPSSVTVENITSLPYSLEKAQKLSKTAKAFKVGATFDITIEFNNAGVLVNEAGECVLSESGTVRGLPAGTYMLQSMNFEPGDATTAGTFKDLTINSMEITANDPNAHYHNYELTSEVEATCTTDGSKTYTCECGDSYTDVVAGGHVWETTWTVDKAATETEDGEKSHHCSKCDERKDITVIKAGSTVVTGYIHNFTTSGLESDFYVFSGTANLAEKGTVEYAGETLTKCLKIESKTNIAFTSETPGTLILVFGGSTNAAGQGIKINGTSYEIDSDQILTKEVEAGTTTITKDNSIFLYYMIFTPEEKEVHTHNYTSEVTVEPTCHSEGEKKFTCECGDTYTEAVETTPHTFSDEWTIDTEATETASGVKSRHCTVEGCDGRTDVTMIMPTGTGSEIVVDKYGDADGSGDVDVADGVVLKKYLAGIAVDGMYYYACDVNADGETDVSDAVLLMKYLAGYDVVLGAPQ